MTVPGSPLPAKLQIGCGTNVLPGYWNVDMAPGPGIDQSFDVARGLPFPDNTFEEILAEDFLSHLPADRGIFVMNEFHRALKPGGVLRLKFPEAPGITAFQDPTHVSFWNFETVTYFLSGHHRREQYGVRHGVTASFRLLKLERWHHQWKKFFGTWNVNYLLDYLLRVELEAVK